MVGADWKPYRTLDCFHALCNSHHFYELIYVFEDFKRY